MKKIALVFICLLLCMSCASCSKEMYSMESYTAQYYPGSNTIVSEESPYIYTGEPFYTPERIDKKGKSSREVDVCGKKFELYYDYTEVNKITGLKYDHYSMLDSEKDEFVFCRFRCDNGKMVWYHNKTKCVNRNFESDVDPRSTEEDFLAYAKKLLKDIAGVSVDDRNMSVCTYVWNDDGKAEWFDGYVNRSAEDPEFKAEYYYTFSSEIGGIPREDTIKVSFTNVGELCGFEAVDNSHNYKKFSEVKIDKEKLEKAVRDAFAETGPGGYKIDYMETSVVTYKDQLFVNAKVVYIASADTSEGSGNVVRGGVEYIVKVAELK